MLRSLRYLGCALLLAATVVRGATFVGSTTFDASSNFTLTISLDSSTGQATFTLTGPTNRWSSVAFGNYLGGNAYAFVANSGSVGNLFEGQVSPFVNVYPLTQQSLANVDYRVVSATDTITFTRDLGGIAPNYYSFASLLSEGATLDMAWALGGTQILGMPAQYGYSTMTFAATAVPEPVTSAIVAGIAALGAAAWCRRRLGKQPSAIAGGRGLTLEKSA